jgi:prepilin-type N-terminal cleavage/methylation domain-containing protein
VSKLSGRARGFTLLELMLALALSVTVLTLLAGGLFAVIQDWERAGKSLESEVETALALHQLEIALHGAFPHVYRDSDENKEYLYFEGKRERLSWVSTVAVTRAPGLSAWQLTPGKDDNGLNLVQLPAYASNPQKALKQTDSLPLFEGYRVRFSYLYIDPRTRDQVEPDSEWLDEWDVQAWQVLPAAVRITLEAIEGERRHEAIALIPANEHVRLRAKPRL